MDLVVQSPGLNEAAVQAFCGAFPQARLRPGAAWFRLEGIEPGAAAARVEALAQQWQCDAALVAPDLDLAAFRLLALDMDSTLIASECIDELAQRAGRGAEVAAITAAAMRGEIADYAESLRLRVAMLKHADIGLLGWVAEHRLQPSPGAERLLQSAHRAGLHTLLVTGGFGFFARQVQQRLGIDSVQANELQVQDGRLTGLVTGPSATPQTLVDAQGKAAALRQACARLGCGTDRAIAIGDGANDLPMLELAGLPVAFRAKPQVRQRIAYRLDYSGLDGVLRWFNAGVDEAPDPGAPSATG